MSRQGSSSAPKRRRPPPAEALSPDAVAAWLRQHPDFLAKNPELLFALTPPERRTGEAVADFQRYMVESQQRQLDALKTSSQDLLAVSRQNKALQQCVHRAVLALLAAPTFGRAIATVTDDWVTYLDLDVVVLAVEATDDSALPELKAGLTRLSPGEVDSRLGRGNDVRAFPQLDPPDPALFSEAASLARSVAWLRLSIHDSAPAGLLALGSREAGRFHPRQNSELLRFLASTLSATIRAWLDLPDPPHVMQR